MIRDGEYTTVLEVDAEAGVIFGHTIGMADEVTFQGETVAEAEESFRKSIDFYLECCQKDGRAPCKPFTGEFRVRIAPEMHRSLVLIGEAFGLSTNEACGRAIAEFLDRIGKSGSEAGEEAPKVIAGPASRLPGKDNRTGRRRQARKPTRG